MKLTCLEKVCVPAEQKKVNEDELYCSESVAFILDGATGLGEPLINNEESDASWFVRNLKSFFTSRLNDNESVEESLFYAVKKTKYLFDEITSKSDVRKFQVPSSGLILVHLKDHTLSIHRLGDCEIYCLLEDGKIWTLPKSPLESFDNHSISLLQKEIAAGKPFSDARKAIAPTLRRTRSKMNSPGGYSALSPGLEYMKHLETKKLDAKKVSKILLCSDGFSISFKQYGICKVDDILSSRAPSLKKIIKEIRKTENDDKSLLKYPRLKPQDDATAIIIEVEKLFQ
ncbi:protein phosphatase 2C domain-containing protein [Marinobacter salsuginis]|uniref:protein phosphatase 2C domain-containing protein n=1 Tax=Marinobacter salsuginis TaxID=418719 RepID=UPI001C963BB6|nr:protein phosphatase 2C domain-containing protein [Marinobacter salsuginis]MBY6071225.1 protein phosphatase 2C domain-containing protein [Marinobacter salsuginis]